MSNKFINPLSQTQSKKTFNKFSVIVEQPVQSNVPKTETCKSILNYIIIITILAIFLVFIPLIEMAVGIKYINTSTCLSHGINGIQVVFVKGFFGLIYLLLFIINNCKKNIDLEKSFWKNIGEFHFLFLIVTFVYAAIHILLMILEFVFLKSCKDYISDVSALLWISAFNTLFAILYIIYTILRALFI